MEARYPPAVAKGLDFSFRSIIVGLLIGVLLNLSNMYYGLQAGSSMQMPAVSGLLGFAIFHVFRGQLRTPFTVSENVLICSAATAVGCMPVTAGFIESLPALEFVLSGANGGPIHPTNMQFIGWSLALSYFGIAFAVLFRDRFVLKRELPWPGATATAHILLAAHSTQPGGGRFDRQEPSLCDQNSCVEAIPWQEKAWALVKGSCVSGFLTLLRHFIPSLQAIPVFGRMASENWLWNLTIAPGFVGQGMLIGPLPTLHMLAGAVIGWAILSPIAHAKGWAPGPVDDWQNGSRAWITWISIAALMADAAVDMLWFAMFPLLKTIKNACYLKVVMLGSTRNLKLGLGQATTSTESSESSNLLRPDVENPGRPQPLNPLTHISLGILFAGAMLACIFGLRGVFGATFPWYYVVLALVLAAPSSLVGIKCLAESDFNPQTTLLSQILFAVIMRQSHNEAIVTNVLAASIATAGASQSGDLAYDFKIGQLVGAHLNVQIWAHVIGSTIGAVVSVIMYKIFTNHYPIPGSVFPIPSSFIQINTAKLLLAEGLPEGALEYMVGCGVLFVAIAILKNLSGKQSWTRLIPSGTSVAIGIYLVPALSIARVSGGIAAWLCTHTLKVSHDMVTVVGVSLILGEALGSAVNIGLDVLMVSNH